MSDTEREGMKRAYLLGYLDSWIAKRDAKVATSERARIVGALVQKALEMNYREDGELFTMRDILKIIEETK